MPAILIGVPKSDENDLPIAWRIEVVKAKGLLCVSPVDKSNPYCEVLWRGPAEKDRELAVYSDWLECGR